MKVSFSKIVHILLAFINFAIKCRFPEEKSLPNVLRDRYGSEILGLFRRFERLEKKVRKLSCDLTFLNTCCTHRLTPKFLRFRLYDARLIHSTEYKNFQSDLLIKEISRKNRLLSSTRKCRDESRELLRCSVFRFDFLHLQRCVIRSAHNLEEHTTLIHSRKLESLGFTGNAVSNPIHNYSDYQLSPSEAQLLSKGPKYVLGPPKPSFIRHFLDFQNFYLRIQSFNAGSNMDSEKRDSFLTQFKAIAHSYFKDINTYYNSNSNLTMNEQKLLRKLQNNNDIIVTRPDKSNGFAILNKQDYVSKMLTILNDVSKFQRVSTPLPVILRRQEDKLNNFLRPLLKQSIIDEATYRSLYSSSAQPGRLYGLLKTHKPDLPLRPILSALNTFNYNLAKYLVPILAPLTTNEYTVSDSFSFAKELCNLNLGSVYMTSFDVKSLYTNIPLKQTIDLCSTNYLTSCIPKFTREVIHKLLTLASSDNVFMFNNELYCQHEGLAMGSPLGASLANAFLCHQEKIWLDQCPPDFKPVLYRRYIDDTFIAFKEQSHVQQFFNYINSQHQSIQFTYECEQNGKLPFLDVTISKTSTGGFNTSLYRKPTYSGRISLFQSFGPLSYKSNLVFTLVYRAWQICSSYDAFDLEIKFLYQLFLNNGYSSTFFWNKANTMIGRLYAPSPPIPTVEKAKVFIPLDYYGRISDKFRVTVTKLVGDIYPQIKLHLAFRNRNTIGSMFQLKDRIPTMQRSRVVYKYTCGICRDTYIGKTMRRLATRVSEHRGRSERTGRASDCPPFSAIRQHMESHGSLVDPECFQIVTSSNGDINLKILETLAIHQQKPKICSQESSLILQIL